MKSNKIQIENLVKRQIILPPFAAACAVVERFLPAVKIGWKSHAIHQNAFIACLADTLMNAMKTVSGVTSVDVNKFNVSNGVLDSFNEESWSRPSTDKITVVWDPTEFLPNSAVTDKIHICVCNEAMDVVWIFLDAAVRSDGTATIMLNHELASFQEVYCLAFTESIKFTKKNNLVGHTQRSGALHV
ncbi:MAG: DUF6266 family protein, partial [Bacteroidales bacterium]